MPLGINPARGCLYDKTYPQLLQFFEILIGVSLTQEGAFKAIFFSPLGRLHPDHCPHIRRSVLHSAF